MTCPSPILTALAISLLLGLGGQVQEAALSSSRNYDFGRYTYYGASFYPDDVDPKVGLRLLVSNDGLNWTDIAAKYLTNNPTGRVGNAMLLWANGRFNLYTCGGPAQTIQTAYSIDGHTYVNYRDPPYNARGRGDFAAEADAQTWAGNWFVDRNGHVYIVWSSNSGRIYYIRSNDDHDFGKDFGDPVRLTGAAMTNGIDPTIYDDGNAYYLFYQSLNNGSPDDRYITVLKSTTGPFSGYDTLVKHGDWTGLGPKSDSPVPYFSVTANTWMMYDDNWGESGLRRVVLRSGDWRLDTDTWSNAQILNARPPKLRAGSFIRVPR